MITSPLSRFSAKLLCLARTCGMHMFANSYAKAAAIRSAVPDTRPGRLARRYLWPGSDARAHTGLYGIALGRAGCSARTPGGPGARPAGHRRVSGRRKRPDAVRSAEVPSDAVRTSAEFLALVTLPWAPEGA